MEDQANINEHLKALEENVTKLVDKCNKQSEQIKTLKLENETLKNNEVKKTIITSTKNKNSTKEEIIFTKKIDECIKHINRYLKELDKFEL